METVAAVGAKKTVNLENLEGLGARRLAELLLELGEENAEIKRRLRLELAGEAGAEVIAADIRSALSRCGALDPLSIGRNGGVS